MYYLILYLYVANITLMPRSITLLQGEKLELATLWGINLKETETSNRNININKETSVLETSGDIENNKNLEIGKIDMSVNLFDKLTLENITVNVIPKTKVIPLGNSIGLKLYTKGVLVVGMSEIEGVKPYENLGIVEGDRIISINNKEYQILMT